MARKTQRDKQRINRYLQLAQPFSFDDEDEDIVNSLDESVGVAAPAPTKQRDEGAFTQEELNLLARGQPLSAPPAVTQSNTPVTSTGRPTTPVVTPTTNVVSSDVLQRRLRESSAPQPMVAGTSRDVTSRSTPAGSRTTTRAGFNIRDLGVTPQGLLGGQVDTQQLAKQLLQPTPEATGNELLAPLGTQFPQPVTEQPRGRVPTQAETVAGITPEEKLLAVYANTNPTPRSLWKRLLIGAARGASQINPNADTLASAFGRIVGGSVAQAIPAVDRATLYQQNKQKALERYKIESLGREAKQKQQKAEADVAEGKARIQESAARRIETAQARRDAILNQVRDDKRAEVTQLLTQLEKTPADDKLGRQRVTKILRDKYDVTVSERYGEKEEREAANITIYDAENDRYIRARADGTPILKDGEPIVVRPGTTAKPETQVEKRKRIEDEEVEKEGTVDNIARDVLAARRESLIAKLPKDAREALQNPGNVSAFELDLAQKVLTRMEAAELKKITSETDTIRKRNIARRMKEEGTTTQQDVVTPRQPGRRRVPASATNAPGTRDFRKPRVIGLP